MGHGGYGLNPQIAPTSWRNGRSPRFHGKLAGVKAIAPTRIVSKMLLALTLSGVFHAWLPVEKMPRKKRMAETKGGAGLHLAEIVPTARPANPLSGS